MRSGIYIFSSDEALLRYEQAALCIKQARADMPDALFLLYTGNDLSANSGSVTNLKHLEGEMADPGLFGGDRIIKINLDDTGPTATDTLKTVAENMRDGVVAVIEMPRLNAAFNKIKPAEPKRRALSEADMRTEKKSGRAKSGEAALKEAFSFVFGAGGKLEIIYPPTDDKLIYWINDRAKRYGLRLSPDGADFLARSAENNLLNIDRSLLVLGHIYTDRTLTAAELSVYADQDSRYSGFELAGAICSGDCLKALSIIQSSCTASGSSKSAAVRLMIFVLNNCISVLYEAHACGLSKKAAAALKKRQRTAEGEEVKNFLRQRGVIVPSVQDSYMKALAKAGPRFLEALNICVSEAAQHFMLCNTDRAYMALQRAAVLCRDINAVRLSDDPLAVMSIVGSQ